MARIKRVSLKSANYLVKIIVDDPDCIFSIKPSISFMKVIRALSEKSAIKNAAAYCKKQMKAYPGAKFMYSSKDVTPYFYPINNKLQEDREICYTKKI